MAQTTSKAHCYFCGKLLTKTGTKRHLLTHAYEGDKAQKCCLVKVESPYLKDYWIYVEIPLTSNLEKLDEFLRCIWLECCGHMSAFYAARYEEISMNCKIANIPIGSVLGYEYDFGSTTELTVSFVGYTARKRQQKAVRLLARNEAKQFQCCICGKPAKELCCDCMYELDNPFFCESCAQSHYEKEEHFMLPVVNSPRMGECGYEGKLDRYEFEPNKLYNKQQQ